MRELVRSLGDYGLKLDGLIRYSLKNSGLSKLVFDSNHVNFVQNNNLYRVVDLRLKGDEYLYEYSEDLKKYERLICPVFMVSGKFVNPEYRFIWGVIRPSVTKKDKHLIINPDNNSEFHFYMDGFEDGKIGQSIYFKDGRLYARIVNSRRMKKHEIGPAFNCLLALVNPEHKAVYFEK